MSLHYTFQTVSTVRATAASVKHTSTHTTSYTKKTATPVLTSTSHSSTPTIDSLLPITMATLTKSSSSSSTWDYPYPTVSSAKSTKNTTSSSTDNLEKVKADLKTYKVHYRNMIIALTLFALVFVAFIAFKIWRFLKARKAKNGGAAATGGRKWYGVIGGAIGSALAKKKNGYEDIELSGPGAPRPAISRPQRPARPATAYFSRQQGPGGVQMI